MDNAIHLTGNLTRDPELRFTNSGMATCGFGIAVNNRKKTASGEFEDEAKFFDVTAFGSLAENVAESVSKGTRVTLTGRLDFQEWTTPDGDRRTKVQVLADSVGPDLRWATATITRNEKRN